MENQLSAPLAARRSERVSIAFPVEASGIDSSGNPFCQVTSTVVVSRYGCSINLPRVLQREQKISLRRTNRAQSVAGRVVTEMGACEPGALYGVATDEPCEALWEIQFSSIYEKVLDSTHDGVVVVDRERRVTYWNDSAEKLSGLAVRDALGKYCFDSLLELVDEAGKPLSKNGSLLGRALLDGEVSESDLYLRHKTGHQVPINLRVLPLRNSSGAIVGAVEIFNDCTAKTEAEKRAAELESLAFRDSLTNLPNRRYLELKVTQALQDFRQLSRMYGLLVLDLDHFKKINDAHGHGVGDAVLKMVADTLAPGLRAGDLVGRWGGEEFVVLLPEVKATVLGDMAERCRLMIAQSSVANGPTQVSTTASIGATFLNDNDSMESVIQRADALMYESKRSGRDRTTVG